MVKANFSLSFGVETDEQTMHRVAGRLDQHVAGQVKDLIAQALDELEFDLTERYWLFTPEASKDEISRPQSTQTLPIWLSDEGRFTEVKIGSADWFELIENEGKFTYRYEDLTFTVRFEGRKSKGKTYYYWRAYATINSKLVAKQLGKTDQLTRESLDEVGAYFLQQSKPKSRAEAQG